MATMWSRFPPEQPTPEGMRRLRELLGDDGRARLAIENENFHGIFRALGHIHERCYLAGHLDSDYARHQESLRAK